MQTVPSLVGTGTAIAAAASGLVFGEAVEPDDAFIARPTSHSFRRQNHDTSRAPSRAASRSGLTHSSRPGTSSAAPSIKVDSSQYNTAPPSTGVSRPPLSRYQRPKTSQIVSPRAPSRNQSISRHGEANFNTIAETPRTSFSSTGSWYRRLSIRPSSQHDSPRSSVGPDSSSIAFSHGSAAPILSSQNPIAPPTPNKLVKRSSSTSAENPLIPSRPRSKSHLPSLRRPATSHQRSATLQYQTQLHLETPVASSHNSIDRNSPSSGLLPSPLDKDFKPRSLSGWASFFHARTASAGGRNVGRVSEQSSYGRYTNSKRVHVFGTDHRQRAHLVKPSMVSANSTPPAEVEVPADIDEEPEKQGATFRNVSASAESTPAKRAKRSLSMTFSSAANLVSRTSGSIRRPKRGETPTSGGNRHVSEPVTSAGPVTERRANTTERVATAPHPHASMQGSALASASKTHSQARNRHTSSPAPPLSTFSSLRGDLPLSKSSGALTQNLRQNQPSGSSTSSTAMSQLRVHHHERTSSALDGSESEAREFLSGDDDDTDFKSDMFDSLRTGASGRQRAVETPLDSMYDESPPSTAGNGKAKRLSIHEILGKDWDGNDKILEEDESAQTPVRTSRGLSAPFPGRDVSNEPRFSTESGFSKDNGRFSMDDDFDEDWTRDEDAPYNALSAPSKGSLNSRGVNPNIRLALASVSGNSMAESNSSDNRTERPLSNLFEWSEPKQEAADSLRPQTAYANQQAEPRGGRSAIRKGPIPTHVRSQSVPNVQEAVEEKKPAGSKYGTWGVSKTISEDWGDDFEFGGSPGNGGKSNDHLFAVPESIQAAQPSVKAHSGQIRELSLLVNDLQRLCRRGRQLDLLEGPQEHVWKEAEGIIALASPDDDTLEADHETTSSIDLDAFEAHERAFDDEFESASLDKLDAALDGREPPMSKTAVVRDRPSPRRRSVFSPDDDIFGGSWPHSEDNLPSNRPSRPRTPEPKLGMSPDVNGVVRSVVEVMQHKSTTEAWLDGVNASNNKVHFDTNSLKLLVKKAGDLRDLLSDIVRKADPITQSPVRTPRHERQLESSPAFTKVFDDPGSSPPRRTMRSRGNTTMVDDASPDNSPSSGIGRRLQMMTVK